jgi:hypothetical protein
MLVVTVVMLNILELIMEIVPNYPTGTRQGRAVGFAEVDDALLEALDVLRVQGERPAGEPRDVFSDGRCQCRLRVNGNKQVLAVKRVRAVGEGDDETEKQ